MNARHALCLSLVPAFCLLAQDPPREGPRASFAVREADLRDILRVAAQGTDLNLTFEPGLDLTVKGLDLKQVTLQEILDQVLPVYGLACTRTGRTLHIHRSDGGMRFYQVDFLALRRTGGKHFSVNASGQLIQGQGVGGQGGGAQAGLQGGMQGQGQGQGAGGGNTAAYMSTLQSGSQSDPWREVEQGLSILVFGEPAPAREGTSSTGQGAGIPGPQPQGYAKGGRSLLIQPDAGLVAIGADPATHRRVEAYLEALKRRFRRQVLLEARIVEVTLGKDSQLGTDWQAVLKAGAADGGGTTVGAGLTTPANTSVMPTGAGLFSLVAKNMRVNATLSAMARDGRLQVLSSPRLATLNNQKAILRVVREEAYFLQTSQITTGGLASQPIATSQVTPVVVPVGIVLDIQPQIGEDGVVTLAVNPSVSEVVSVASFQSQGTSATLPVVDRRDLDTVVKLRSGETLVLAGIIKEKASTEDRGVPWLRRVPILGYLLGRKEKTRAQTELAIFITPFLLDDPDQVQQERQRTEGRVQPKSQEDGM